jgi:hypothetical protein
MEKVISWGLVIIAALTLFIVLSDNTLFVV